MRLADGDPLQLFERLLRNQHDPARRRASDQRGAGEEIAPRAAKVLDARHQHRVVATAFEGVDQGGLGFVGEARPVGVSVREPAHERPVGDEVGGAEAELAHGGVLPGTVAVVLLASRAVHHDRARDESVLLIAPVQK